MSTFFARETDGMSSIPTPPQRAPHLHLRTIPQRPPAWLTAAILVLALSIGCGDDQEPGQGQTSETSTQTSSTTGQTTPTTTPQPDGGDVSDAEGDIEEDPSDVSPPDDVLVDVDPQDTSDTSDTSNPPDDVSPDTSEPDDVSPPEDTSPDVFQELPPTLLGVSPERGPIQGGNTVLFTGNHFTQETQIFIGTRRVEDLEFLNTTQMLGIAPPGVLGSFDVKVINTLGEDQLPNLYTYFEPLRIQSVNPGRSPIQGGIQATVEGSGFDETTLVTVAGRSAIETTLVDSRTLRIITPPAQAGRQDVRISNRDSSSLLAGGIVYYQPLKAERVWPASGPSAGGTVVQLYGQGFDNQATVRVGDLEASTTFVSETQLTFIAPPGAPGFADIAVSGTNGVAGLVSGYYYQGPSSEQVELYGVAPSSGPTAGGTVFTLVGQNLDHPDTVVTFGGVPAEILERSPTTLQGRTPEFPSAQAVDVRVAGSPMGSAELPEAFVYIQQTTLTSVEPSSGPLEGGVQVTLAGTGFEEGAVVRFGPSRAQILDVQEDAITVLAPPGTLGPVDVSVTQDGLTTRLFDAFAYTQDIEIFGMQPTTGSVAGGTFVVLRGEGFASTPRVWFGENEGTDVQRLDTSTITVRSPAWREGTVPVRVLFEGTPEMEAPERFVYFNPGSAFGGTWGDEIQGAVNVSVFQLGGSAIPNAFVILNVDASTPYQGFTDENGQVTFSGPDLSGEQTVTAIAAGYSSATVQSFNSENVSVLLTLLDAEGDPPPGPPLGTITGEITGVEKVGDPGPNEFELAIVYTTQRSPFSPNPPTGNGNVVLGNGTYTLQSRTGDVAVVAVAGLYNNATETYRPLYMAVARGINVQQGQPRTVNLDLDIPLNSPITFKVSNAPRGNLGPSTNQVIPYLDFGYEGVWAGPDTAQGDEEFITASHQPSLSNPQLSGVSFTFLGGAWTGQGQAPYSLALIERVSEVGPIVELPELLGVPQPFNPVNGGIVSNNYVEFDPNNDVNPDFYFINIKTFDDVPVWNVILPGNEPYFQLPNFPDFSNLPFEERPAPYVEGPLVMEITSARAREFDYDNFDFNDFSIDNWEVFTFSSWVIILADPN